MRAIEFGVFVIALHIIYHVLDLILIYIVGGYLVCKAALAVDTGVTVVTRAIAEHFNASAPPSPAPPL